MARNALNAGTSPVGKTIRFSIITDWIARKSVVFAAVVLAVLHIPNLAQSAPDLSQLCDRAAVYAAQKTGVPVSVLQAISLTETGRKRGGAMRPWPWAVNMEGKGVWFDNEDDARAYVYKHYKRGARSFDVGCFQINYKWHGQEFSSIEEMFDPNPNALYAAKFLLNLYREKGNWGSAAGAYHSRTAKYADKYEERFTAFRTALLGKPPVLTVAAASAVTPSPVEPAVRINLYPLLQQGGTGRTPGSLVPLGGQQSARRLIPLGGQDG